MTSKLPCFYFQDSLKKVLKDLEENSLSYSSVNYIYLVDEEDILCGVASVKEVLRGDRKSSLNEVARKEVVKVLQTTDQEEVVILALKYKLKAIPVVDESGKFLGAVISDKILEILDQEQVEDALKMVGLNKEEDPVLTQGNLPIFQHVGFRLPWLLFGLLGGILAASILSFFEKSIEKELILVAFIPAVVYMADAVGGQTQMILVRALSGNLSKLLYKFIFHEVKVNLIISVILGVTISLYSGFSYNNPRVSLVLGLSIFNTVLVSTVIGLTLPLIFNKLKIDPAVASGPFATVIRDLSSLLIYFTVAFYFI